MKTCGFTLIELLVVISIISALSSVVFATVAESRVKAHQVTNAKIVQQYILALQQYYLDNNQYPHAGLVREYCLGNATNGDCAFDSSENINNTINNQFATYYPSLSVGQPMTWLFGMTWEGPVYSCNAIVDGKCKWGSITDLVKGDSRQLCANACNVQNFTGGYWMCVYNFGESSVYNEDTCNRED